MAFLNQVKAFSSVIEEMGNPFIDESNHLLDLDTRDLTDSSHTTRKNSVLSRGKLLVSLHAPRRKLLHGVSYMSQMLPVMAMVKWLFVQSTLMNYGLPLRQIKALESYPPMRIVQRNAMTYSFYMQLAGVTQYHPLLALERELYGKIWKIFWGCDPAFCTLASSPDPTSVDDQLEVHVHVYTGAQL